MSEKGRLKKLSVVGAGQVGATVAFLALQKKLAAEIVLLDVVDGLPQGKALDMGQASPLLEYSAKIAGTSSYKDIAGSDVVVITAGLARKPGMTRMDLMTKNAEIIKLVVEKIAEFASQTLILMVTNPLDVMAHLAYKVSGFSPERVFGQSGLLDSARFSYFIAEVLNVPVEEVSAMVLGGHGDSMVPLVSQATVSGKPLAEVLPEEKINSLIERTRKGGAEIVSYLKSGSAYYAPASATLKMVEAIAKDSREILPISTYLQGEYSLEGVYTGVPVRLGREGVAEIVELEISVAEREALHRSAAISREAIKELLSEG